MAVLFFSGWETGDFSEFSLNLNTNGTTTVDTAIVNPGGGKYSFKIVTNASTAPNCSSEITENSAPTSVWVRFFFYLDSVGASITAAKIFHIDAAAGGAVCDINLTTDASSNPSLFLQNQVSSTQVGSAFAIKTATWYCIEFHNTIAASGAVLEFKVNGVVAATSSTQNTGTSGNKFFYFMVNDNTSIPAVTCHFDDLFINTTGYIGRGVCKAWQPNATAPLDNAWTKSTGSIQNCWNTTPFNTTTFISDATTSAKQTGVANVSSAVDTGAQNGPLALISIDVINSIKIGLVGKTSSTTSDGTDSTIIVTNSVETDTALAAWTTSDAYQETYPAITPTAAQLISQCQYGILKASSGAPTHTIEDAWVMLDVSQIRPGRRRSYQAQSLPYLRHHFTNPQHVRIYHPKPAQYETLLVPVMVRPRPQIYPKKWKLPAGWRAAEKFKGRLWHWPQEFMTLLVPVKPRPVPFRTRIHWKLPSDIRRNVLRNLKRPAAFFIAAALPKFRTRARWKLPAGWRERLRFPLKYRPAEFMTLLVPVRPRPDPLTTRSHWKLPALRDLNWNPLHRPRASAFNPAGVVGANAPKRSRPRWIVRHEWVLRKSRRLGAQLLTGAIVRHYRVRAVLHQIPLRHRLKFPSAQLLAVAAIRHLRLPSRSQWRFPEGWRARLRFLTKYRPAEFITLLVPIKPLPFRPRWPRWKLPAGWRQRLIFKHREWPAEFMTLLVPARRLIAKRWGIRPLLSRLGAYRRPSAAPSLAGVVRHYRVPRAPSRPQRHRLAKRLGTQPQAVTVVGSVRLVRRARQTITMTRRLRRFQRTRASAEMLAIGIKHGGRRHSNSSVANAGFGAIIQTLTDAIVIWRSRGGY